MSGDDGSGFLDYLYKPPRLETYTWEETLKTTESRLAIESDSEPPTLAMV